MKIKIKKSHVSLGLLVLIVSLMITGSQNQSVKPQDKYETPKTSAGEITIVTPENKTYTEPDSGYYSGTFGFESDAIGSSPQGWTEFSEADRKTTVEELYGEHKRVFKIYKNTAAALTTVNYFESQSTGTVEFWWVVEDIYDLFTFTLDDDGPWAVVFTIRDGYFKYRDSSVYHTIPGAPIPQNNQWYHIRIDFRCTGAPAYQGLNENRYFAYIDGIKYGDFPFVENKSFFERSRFGIGTGSIETTYVDAVGYSWDPHYIIGDNLNEGLLLSYYNTTNLDWQGYSLDGQTNRTILGNTTIPMPTDGLHTIQVFGNDSVGTMYESDMRYFTINTAPPEITINAPTHSQTIGSTAPSYDVSITGLYDSIWYTLDGGITNITASSLTGTLNQVAWAALADGIITVIFFANNSAGIEDTSQVMVIKDSSEEPPPTPPGIPGYDLYIFIGALSVLSALLIRKRTKS